MAHLKRRIWKNEAFQTAFIIIIIVSVVFGFWFGSQLILNTEIPPALAVVSGSMCIPYGRYCDGWTHPFDNTLHVGDIIIIQGVDAKDLKTTYPESDIIVFHKPDEPDELIVHRIISAKTINGVTYFKTKGDGNGNPYPQTPLSNIDTWANYPNGVPEDLVVGKVVMRVPWIGWIAIAMQKAGANNSTIIPLLVVLIILLVLVEFVPPLLKRKKKPTRTATEYQQMQV